MREHRRDQRGTDSAGATLVHTLGHSRHTLERFIELLAARGIETVVDTRGQPYSRFNPQFNRETLGAALARRGIGYVWQGEHLSGRPRDRRLYGSDGRLDRQRVASSPDFVRAIEALAGLARGTRLVLVCAEEDPRRCHRRFLLTPPLIARGLRVVHLRGDGRIEPEETIAEPAGPLQGDLFAQR